MSRFTLFEISIDISSASYSFGIVACIKAITMIKTIHFGGGSSIIMKSHKGVDVLIARFCSRQIQEYFVLTDHYIGPQIKTEETLEDSMETLCDGVKGIVRRNDHILVLVKPNGTLDLPGGRVENGETIKSALRREIDEETSLKVEIHDPVEEWSFYKTPDRLIKGLTMDCAYLEGNVKLCGEHKSYFWAAIDRINHLIFNRNFLKNLKFT